jgi:hypothetical protein
MSLFEDSVTYRTAIHQYDRIFGRCEVFEDNFHDILFLFGFDRRNTHVDVCLESCSFNLLLHNIRGQGYVDWSALNPAFPQRVVDQGNCLMRIIEFSHGTRYASAHIGKDIEIAVAKGMVQKHPIFLRDCAGLANDMDDWNKLGVAAWF